MMVSGLIQYSSPAERSKAIQNRAKELRERQEIDTADGTWVRVPVESLNKKRP